jgi:adenine phosphoribosyltransferase
MDLDLARYIRDVPDFPQKGIVFKDITPLLRSPAALKQASEELALPFKNKGIVSVVAIEARGYILGGPVAYLLGAGLVPVRKPGKLPHKTIRTEYALEYGSGVIEVHEDGIRPSERVLILDDVLATGGTLQGAARLVEQAGGVVAGMTVLAEITALRGRERLQGYEVTALLRF